MPSGEQVLKLNDHNQAEVRRMLLEGAPDYEVEAWLRTHNRNNKRQWVSAYTLGAFRINFLKQDPETLENLKKIYREKKREKVLVEKQALVRKTDEYLSAQEKIVDNIIDIQERFKWIHDKIIERIKILESKNFHFTNESVIVSYLKEMRGLMSDLQKSMNPLLGGDGKSGNVNINISQQQVEVGKAIREVVMSVLEEMSPELIPRFLDLFEQRMIQSGTLQQQQINVQVNQNTFVDKQLKVG
jgi:hypothetical protein